MAQGTRYDSLLDLLNCDVMKAVDILSESGMESAKKGDHETFLFWFKGIKYFLCTQEDYADYIRRKATKAIRNIIAHYNNTEQWDNLIDAMTLLVMEFQQEEDETWFGLGILYAKRKQHNLSNKYFSHLSFKMATVLKPHSINYRMAEYSAATVVKALKKKSMG